MTHSIAKWLSAYLWIAGSCDASTGVLLICAPHATLRLMGIRPEVVPSEIIGFLGAFVLAVGLSYLYAAILSGSLKNQQAVEAVWIVRAVTRSSVAVYVTF